ncbi:MULTISPECIES: cytochrome c [unclassified Paracoccus (in: a-proteobacteria)]|nr:MULTISPECIES: cytochrome c [unclassified Paracoccus (in: a-proteobacteria)]MBB1493001.1 cytochrome c [Paracoccus sp. MC1854]QQO45134.1 cytochrome c [Paracoccus sp. MC1862]
MACALMLSAALPPRASAQQAAPAPAATAAAPILPTAGPPAGTDTAAPTEPVALPEGVTPEMMADGEKLFFQNCRRCHGMRGKAGVPLSGNENIADAAYIASIIINGRGYMPPLGEHLSDEQIALIATFARNSWGNAYGHVIPQDVKDMR